MPYSAKDIELKVKQRVNKKDTDDFDNLQKFAIQEAYNKAQVSVVNFLYEPKDRLRQGIEATRKRVDDLKILINPIPVTLTTTAYDGFELTTTLPADYLHYINSKTQAKTSLCSKKVLRNHLVEESNIDTLLSDEFIKPSFEWGETLVTLVGNQIKVYVDNFDVTNVKLTYLRKPKNIELGGYIKDDGSPSAYIDPEMSDEIVELCIDWACMIIQGDIQNQFGVQIAQLNMQEQK